MTNIVTVNFSGSSEMLVHANTLYFLLIITKRTFISIIVPFKKIDDIFILPESSPIYGSALPHDLKQADFGLEAIGDFDISLLNKVYM